VIEKLPIDLPRPRDRSVVSSPRFVAMKKYCLDLLHLAAPEQSPAPIAA
jgi:hypothetical protein